MMGGAAKVLVGDPRLGPSFSRSSFIDLNNLSILDTVLTLFRNASLFLSFSSCTFNASISSFSAEASSTKLPITNRISANLSATKGKLQVNTSINPGK